MEVAEKTVRQKEVKRKVVEDRKPKRRKFEKLTGWGEGVLEEEMEKAPEVVSGIGKLA